MSILSRAWALAPTDARAQLLRVADAASALVNAFGGTSPALPTTASSGEDVAAWEQAFETESARVDGPTVDTLSGLPRGPAALTWPAVVARYAAAPAGVRHAVVSLQSAYGTLGTAVRVAVDDGAVRTWLVLRADRAGYPNTGSLSQPVAPARAPRATATPSNALVAALAIAAGLLVAARGRRGRG